MNKEERKLRAEALLMLDTPAKEVATRLGIPYQTVQSWKRKLDTDTKDVNTVVKVDSTTLHAVADKIRETAPDKIANKVDKLVEGVTSLQTLEPKFHSVVMNLLEAAEEMSMRNDLSVKDWSMLSSGIGQLYANIFNKSGVNVNVLNQTQVNNEKMQMFKGSMRNV